jgi:hypothetical protein
MAGIHSKRNPIDFYGKDQRDSYIARYIEREFLPGSRAFISRPVASSEAIVVAAVLSPIKQKQNVDQKVNTIVHPEIRRSPRPLLRLCAVFPSHVQCVLTHVVTAFAQPMNAPICTLKDVRVPLVHAQAQVRVCWRMTRWHTLWPID